MLGLVILLCPVFENPGEFSVVEHSIFDRSFSVHFINLIISEPVSNGGQQLSKTIFMNQANIFFIKTTKCVFNYIFRISSLESFSKEGQEHCEVDWPWSFTHHALQVLLSWVLAQRCKHVVEILIIYKPISVVINHVEGLLELLDLVLVEHGKHIAGRPLSPLLCGSTTSCGLPGRHPDF